MCLEVMGSMHGASRTPQTAMNSQGCKDARIKGGYRLALLLGLSIQTVAGSLKWE